MARPQKCRCICSMPQVREFGPINPCLNCSDEIVVLGLDEYEVIRLLDYVNMSQERCAERMNIARTTVTRMYESARAKIAKALVQGLRIEIDGGEVTVCRALKPECVGEIHCCHRNAAMNNAEIGGDMNEACSDL